jgi:hypothetical protein
MEFIWLARESTFSQNLDRSALESILTSWSNFARISELLRDDEWAIFLTTKAWPELYDSIYRNVDSAKNNKKKLEYLSLLKNAQWISSSSKKEQYVSQYLRSQKGEKDNKLETEAIREILRLIDETKGKIDLVSYKVTGGPTDRQLSIMSKEFSSLREHKSEFVLERYKVFFSDQLANRYQPIIYSGECMSGNPEGLYYRILKNSDKNEFCIQYFCYWLYQECMMTSHTYDYEPIFIYLKPDDPNPYLIVNSGLGGPDCNFSKNEVHPRHGKRVSKDQHVAANLARHPFYPFGRDGNVRCRECISIYPLDTGEDLQFEGFRPLFGVRACSNVFSGAEGNLHGDRFNPSLKKLTDRVLGEWYFHHYENTDDMPFGYDIADPFAPPYIKFYKPSKEEVEKLRQQRRYHPKQ